MQINEQNRHVQLDIRDPAFYNDPYPTYAELQARCPVYFWEDYGLWTFTRHVDVTTILRDRRFGRQITHIKTPEELGWDPEPERLKPFYDVDRLSMLDLEPPAHSRLRGLVQKAFMARQIERLRPRIASLSNELIDKMMDGNSCNLLDAFATPIPVIVIAEMLGVPAEMAPNLLEWSHAMVRMYEMERSAETEQAAVKAATDFSDYLRSHVKQRRKSPQDDLISKLIEVEEAGEKLTEDELISTCILLLNAGHEATVNVVGNGVLALLNNPEQLAAWRADESMSKTAVEELMRFDTPLHQFNRFVLEPLEFGGVNFKVGDQVALLLGAANRDSAEFENAQSLDLSRKHNPHVSLGGGIHYCLGAPLARLELQTSIPILLNRLPNLSIKETPQFRNSFHFHGLEELIVTW